ncbi:Transmembrane protein 165 [Pteropus alecto]|uniref:GDT1 family protein n=1 Tax=Pteropus alecto TaxID=9402 RepID=L5JX83_PTEAL|nr:Transmembrane protein 165 [Pteropus alecto]
MAAAAARGSGRASAPWLLLLLLVPLLCVPAGVRAVPDEDLSHRNKEPPAPAQQLQPQPAAAQGPEPARAEKGLTPAAPVHNNKEDPDTQTNLGFIHAFVAAISVIIVSELGDKTFFIAAIMAMRYNRLTVLAGAMLALGLMTCLSVLFGYATTVIPRVYTYYVSTALFAIFGIRMLREGLKMSPDEGQEELEEVQAELKKKDEEFQRTKLLNGPGDIETGTSTTIPQKKWLHFISPIFVQALTLTFLAEWGDRSQLTTIVLAAREGSHDLMGLRKLSFLYALTHVPVNEGTLGIHQVASPGFSNSCGVAQHTHSSLYFGQSPPGSNGRLIINANSEASEAPVHKLGAALGLDDGNGSIDIFGNHITHGTTGSKPCIYRGERHISPSGWLAQSTHW